LLVSCAIAMYAARPESRHMSNDSNPPAESVPNARAKSYDADLEREIADALGTDSAGGLESLLMCLDSGRAAYIAMAQLTNKPNGI
jgi:hypothetical protein